jgi:hypothetical protein
MTDMKKTGKFDDKTGRKPGKSKYGLGQYQVDK